MEKKIAKWVEKGLISKEIAISLLADVKEESQKSHKLKMNITIYTIAVILIGIGVISFICANDWILKLLNSSVILKISLMFLVTALSFWGGYELAYDTKKFPRLGNALITLSSLLIGATYALIGQSYNINANNSGFLFIWIVSILPVAYLFKNYVVNFIAIILSILCVIFYYGDLGLDHEETWTIFIPVIIGVMLYVIGNIPFILKKYNNFSLSYKLTGLIPIFFTLLVLTCSVEESYKLVSVHYFVPIITLFIFNLVNYFMSKDSDKRLLSIETIFISAILIFLALLLLIPVLCKIAIIILVNIILISIIMLGFNYGYKLEHSRLIGLTNFFLIIYLIVNYVRWGWSYMDKSLFFILGGISLLIIGMLLEKKRKTVVKGK